MHCLNAFSEKNIIVLDNPVVDECFLLFGKGRSKTSKLGKAVAVVPNNAPEEHSRGAIGVFLGLL